MLDIRKDDINHQPQTENVEQVFLSEAHDLLDEVSDDEPNGDDAQGGNQLVGDILIQHALQVVRANDINQGHHQTGQNDVGQEGLLSQNDGEEAHETIFRLSWAYS